MLPSQNLPNGYWKEFFKLIEQQISKDFEEFQMNNKKSEKINMEKFEPMKMINNQDTLSESIRSKKEADKFMSELNSISQNAKQIEPPHPLEKEALDKKVNVDNIITDLNNKYNKEFQELIDNNSELRDFVEGEQKEFHIRESQDRTINFLKQLKESDETIIHIFNNGSCYKLCKILKTLYPSANALYSREEGHWITEIDGGYYDIGGKINVQYVIDKAYENLPELEASADIPTFTNNIGVVYGKYV